MTFLKNNSGASAVEFALVAPVIVAFIAGILQFGYVLWVDNLLHYAVDAAARCGGVGSTTAPCPNPNDRSVTAMTAAANAVFAPAVHMPTIKNLNFSANCAGTGSGLTGTLTISILKLKNLQLTANSCYPTY